MTTQAAQVLSSTSKQHPLGDISQALLNFLNSHVNQSFLAADLHALAGIPASKNRNLHQALSNLKAKRRIAAYNDYSASSFYYYTSIHTGDHKPSVYVAHKTAAQPIVATSVPSNGALEQRAHEIALHVVKSALDELRIAADQHQANVMAILKKHGLSL